MNGPPPSLRSQIKFEKCPFCGPCGGDRFNRDCICYYDAPEVVDFGAKISSQRVARTKLIVVARLLCAVKYDACFRMNDGCSQGRRRRFRWAPVTAPARSPLLALLGAVAAAAAAAASAILAVKGRGLSAAGGRGAPGCARNGEMAVAREVCRRTTVSSTPVLSQRWRLEAGPLLRRRKKQSGLLPPPMTASRDSFVRNAA